MTFDNAISWLLSIAEHEGEDIPIYDTDVEAIQMGIDAIHKYQKIEQIISEWNYHCISTQVAISEIANEVLEDENVN